MEENISLMFNLFQWNTLNRKLSDKKSFPYVEEKYLEWEYRQPLLKKIIEENKGDIICLEEVGKFEKDFKEDIFEKLNIKYDLIFGNKARGFMGSVLGVNKEIFSIENSINLYMDGIDGKKSGANTLFALVKENKTNNKFVVAAIHFRAKEENENVRILEMNHLMKYLEENYLRKYPIFLLGDFNAEPTYQCIINLFENKNISAKSILNLKELDFTTIKLRDKLYRRIIDYIFFVGKNQEDKDELKVISAEKGMPNIDEKIGLPNDIFPSDHLYLKAKIELKFV